MYQSHGCDGMATAEKSVFDCSIKIVYLSLVTTVLVCGTAHCTGAKPLSICCCSWIDTGIGRC